MFRTKALAEAIVDGVVFERDPTTLTPDHVDSELWDIVEQINHTRWAWTRFCCHGHWNHELDTYKCDPYLQVTCHRKHLHRVTTAANTAIESSLNSRPELLVSFSVKPASPNWVICTLHALDLGETGLQTLPAARSIVQEFGHLIAQHEAS
jgi:hypothetical protein